MDKNKIWNTPEEIAYAVMQGYSVTDKETIRKQYLAQVAQYPLYEKWFEKIEAILTSPQIVVEYGSGPGVLAERLKDNKNVLSYTAIEPGETFREMTIECNPKAFVFDATAETYVLPGGNFFDCAIATATYHHFHDKVKSLDNIYRNLKIGGQLIIADGFLPVYEFDENFNPTDKAEFVDAVMKYVSAQIKLMPNPTEADIEDQMRTAILDTLRVEELKVCMPILEKQLALVGFQEVKIELMRQDDERVNYNHLGWYFVTAKKL